MYQRLKYKCNELRFQDKGTENNNFVNTAMI